MRGLLVTGHLAGVVLWVGGAVALALVVACAAADDRPRAAALARKVARRVVTPGMLAAWGFGLGVLVPNFTTLYAKAGWMHAKLTLLLVLTGLTGVLTARMRKLGDGQPTGNGVFSGLGLGLGGLAVVVIALAILRPF